MGAGKRFPACALGHQACVIGYKTFYLNLNRFTEKIMVAKLDGSFVKLLNQLDRASLLILDDFGLAPMDQNARLALLQILEDRFYRVNCTYCDFYHPQGEREVQEMGM